MSLSDITIIYPVGTNNVYSVADVKGSQALYTKVGSTMLEPVVMERSSTKGDGYKKTARHLVKINQTKKSATDATIITTGGVHVVIAESGTVSGTELKNLWNQLKVYLTDTKIDEILAGSLS